MLPLTFYSKMKQIIKHLEIVLNLTTCDGVVLWISLQPSLSISHSGIRVKLSPLSLQPQVSRGRSNTQDHIGHVRKTTTYYGHTHTHTHYAWGNHEGMSFLNVARAGNGCYETLLTPSPLIYDEMDLKVINILNETSYYSCRVMHCFE